MNVKGHGLLLLSLSLFGGVTAVVNGQTAKSRAEEPPGLSVLIKQPQRSFRVGEVVKVGATITNISSLDLFVGPFLDFEIRDAADRPVPKVQSTSKSPAGWSASSSLLKPGQSIDRTIDLKEEFAITSPGTYIVRALRCDYGPRGGKV